MPQIMGARSSTFLAPTFFRNRWSAEPEAKAGSASCALKEDRSGGGGFPFHTPARPVRG